MLFSMNYYVFINLLIQIKLIIFSIILLKSRYMVDNQGVVLSKEQ